MSGISMGHSPDMDHTHRREKVNPSVNGPFGTPRSEDGTLGVGVILPRYLYHSVGRIFPKQSL